MKKYRWPYGPCLYSAAPGGGGGGISWTMLTLCVPPRIECQSLGFGRHELHAQIYRIFPPGSTTTTDEQGP